MTAFSRSNRINIVHKYHIQKTSKEKFIIMTNIDTDNPPYILKNKYYGTTDLSFPIIKNLPLNYTNNNGKL